MKFFKGLLIPAAVLSIFLTGCGGGSEEIAVMNEEPDLTAVEVQHAEAGSIKSELVYAGQVQPNETVDVTSKLSGQVESIFFDLGDKVNKGDVLFTLDKKDIQDQIKQLEAQLKISNASVSSAQTSLAQVNGGQSETQILSMKTALENAATALDNAKIQMDNAKLAVETSKANLDDVTKNYENMKVLYNAGTISKNDFDSVELGYTQAQKGYDQAVNSYNQAQLGLTQSQTAYDQAQESYNIYVNKITQENETSAKNGVNTAIASRQSVQTQLSILRSTLNDTSVRSPITGTISKKNISETNMVSAQSAPFTIVDMSKVTVDVQVSERVINLISQGQSVDVYIPTISDNVITGTIRNISPSADNTRTYPVKIEIDNSSGIIKPGMFAEIHFVESQKDNTIVVPRSTVIENESEKYIYVVSDGKAIKKVVVTGVDNGESIEILQGAEMGDNIIVKGQAYVTNGEDVNVVNGKEEEKAEETTSKEE